MFVDVDSQLHSLEKSNSRSSQKLIRSTIENMISLNIKNISLGHGDAEDGQPPGIGESAA